MLHRDEVLLGRKTDWFAKIDKNLDGLASGTKLIQQNILIGSKGMLDSEYDSYFQVW